MLNRKFEEMSMLRNTVLAIMFVLVGLSGCSSIEERQRANGNYDYVDIEPNEPFKVPEDLDQPERKSDYVIPEVGAKAPKDQIGQKITVLSPSLVLPLVTGSHVEEGMKEATVWFDQIDDSQPLDTTIWNSLLSFLEQREIGVVNFDKEKQILITDWMIIDENADKGWFTWTSTERSIGRRFEFTLDMKPHGRSAQLKTKLKDYLETTGDEVIADIAAEKARRNEVEILNQVISHYELQVRKDDIRRIRQIRSGYAMELGFNSNGDAAYIVDGNYDVVWPRLLLVLRKLGFNVKDLDKSNGLLFVNYGGSDSSWWERWFSANKNALKLEKTAYRIQAKKQGPKTSITLLNNESVPFEVKKVTELFPEFARVMALDNLDI
jgi:outer membrane protein assembly factor BamC